MLLPVQCWRAAQRWQGSYYFHFSAACLTLSSQQQAEKAMAPHSSPLAWKNPMDGGAWWAAVHGVGKSRTRLSDFTFAFPFHALERETATHSSVLAWRILGVGEPGRLPSMGSHRVGHDWGDLATVVSSKTSVLFLFLWREEVPCLKEMNSGPCAFKVAPTKGSSLIDKRECIHYYI